jgi:Na+-translocating ferredoxin:NAD+ oxidoreductase RnfC subunit
VTIETDGDDRWIDRQPLDYPQLHPSDLRNAIRNAGVVGLGGAGVSQRGQAESRAIALRTAGHI